MSNDAKRARQEMAELERQVSAAFEKPETLQPPIRGADGRPRVRIWDRPAFANHRCWTVWGGKSDTGFQRRVEWRRDLDVVRADPVRRLALLGEPVRATLEVQDGDVNIDDLVARLGRLPTARPAELLRQGVAIHLDAGRHGIELDDGSTAFRFESIHPWLSDLCGWLEARLVNS